MGKAVSINRSKIHEPLVQRISGEKAFVAKESGKKLFPTIREFLTFCALLGVRKGVKEPLDRSYGTEDIQGVIYEDTEALEFIWLIALVDQGNTDLLQDGLERECSTIFEAYANGGLGILADHLNDIPEEQWHCEILNIVKETNILETFGNPNTKFLDSDYFKFETLNKVTPENNNHEFWKSQNLDKEYINSKREENLRNGRLLNHGFPIIQEERTEILKCYGHGWTIEEIEFFFQRSRISIEKILEEHDET